MAGLTESSSEEELVRDAHGGRELPDWCRQVRPEKPGQVVLVELDLGPVMSVESILD